MEMEEIEQAGSQTAGTGQGHINLKFFMNRKESKKRRAWKRKESNRSEANKNDLWVLVPSMAELDCNLKLLLLLLLGLG